MNKLILIILIFSAQAYATPEIIKSKLEIKRDTASISYDSGKEVFFSFLKCGETQDRISCMKKYFIPEITKDHLLSYNFIFTSLKRISEAFVCSEETESFIEKETTTKYDVVLCFESSLDKNKIGQVYFRKINGELKISKIKL